VSTADWSAYDEGYLRAYQWSMSLAGGAALPVEGTNLPLGPGEVAHAHFAPVGMFGHFGEQREYRRSFLLVGGPVGLALTGAASVAYNQSKKGAAERAAIPTWHNLGVVDVTVTNQRMAIAAQSKLESLWYAEAGPLSPAVGTGGIPAVQLQPSGMPLMRLESPYAPMLYVFVHHLVDGRPPGVPLPDGLLERAQAQGRM
jgi:hypothetical protein